MNLSQTINVLPLYLPELFSGGTGSGPNAPCPQCGPHNIQHKIEEKDIVKLKNGDTLYNYKTGNIDKFGPGLKAVVVNVLPKVGDNPQLLKVNILPPSKKHEQDNFRYLKTNDVALHKAADTANPVKEIKDVPKGQVISKFKTADGANVTWIRQHQDTERDPKTMKQISEEPHYLKGKFAQVGAVKGIQDKVGQTRVTRTYETSGMPSHMQTGSNATVYVDSYTRKGAVQQVNVKEQNTTSFGQKTKGALSFEYNLKGKFGDTGVAKAVGMLRQRYGIKVSMKRLASKDV